MYPIVSLTDSIIAVLTSSMVKAIFILQTAEAVLELDAELLLDECVLQL